MIPTRKAIEDSGLKPSEIDKILLVGGSSRIPAVQEAIKNYIGKEPHKGINPDECVAIGAAIQGGVLQGDVKGIVLLDVTPLSLGVETLGGVCTRIIERNTTIPVKKSMTFSTAADNQPSVTINVLQGEREMAADNKSIGNFNLDGIPPAPRGVPQIEVTFDIDANGIVNVSAKELGTGKEQRVTITASTNMSKEDVEKAVADAEKFAAEDKKRRETIDAKNQAEQLCYQCEKAMTDAADKLTDDDKAGVNAEIEKVREALKGEDAQAINAASEALSKKFYELAPKLYPQQQGQPDAQAGTVNDDGTINADFQDKNE